MFTKGKHVLYLTVISVGNLVKVQSQLTGVNLLLQLNLMKQFILFSLLLSVKICHGQSYKIVYQNPKDTTQNFYVIRLPKNAIKGLLVLNDRALSDSAKLKAYNLGICTLTIVPTSQSLDNLTSNDILNSIDNMIGAVIKIYKIPKQKIVIGGMSVAGTGAIRYAEYCFSNKSKQGIKPIGVFGVDPPLDYQRLYYEAKNSIKRNFSRDAVDEGKLITKLLTNNLKGTPETNIKSYQANSPFCYSATNGGNTYLLNNLAVRVYTEPDINWWIDNRRKDFYDINAIDNAALINQLKLNGNSKANLITTNYKGVNLEGHPHSWSIVDEDELLIWCNELFDKL